MFASPRQDGAGAVLYPGPRAIGHCRACWPVPDETIARLAEIDADLAACETVHLGGHRLDPGDEIALAVRRVMGRPDLSILSLAAPFVPIFRELLEMRYLRREPLPLDNRKLVGMIGAEPHTPLDEAISRSLAGPGCLSPNPIAAAGEAAIASSPAN